MRDDIEQVLIDRRQIADRVRQVAAQITRDFADVLGDDDHARGITLVPILTGSMIFVADLMRHLPLRVRIRLVSVSGYPGATTVSKGAMLREQLTHLPTTLRGSHVLVLDDILDSGQTLKLVTDLLAELQPAAVRTCVLLRKDLPSARAFPVDYVGFDIPDKFVVGYGLDYNDYYRNLPEIVTLRPAAIAAGKADQPARGQR
jgi:hypoxanthine phosphoribosyltransferase